MRGIGHISQTKNNRYEIFMKYHEKRPLVRIWSR